MTENKSVRISKLVKEFNVKIDRILDFLEKQGLEGLNPNSKISYDVYMKLLEEFDASKAAKISAQLLAKEKELERAEEIIKNQELLESKAKLDEEKAIAKAKAAEEAKQKELAKEKEVKKTSPKVIGNVDLTKKNDVKKDIKVKDTTSTEAKPEVKKEDEIIKFKSIKLKGLTSAGEKIDLSKFDTPKKATSNSEENKRKRKKS